MSNIKTISINGVPALPHNPFADMPGEPIKSVALPFGLIHLAHVRVQDRYDMNEIASITELHVCMEIRKIVSEELHMVQNGRTTRFAINPMAYFNCVCGDIHAPKMF